MFCKQGVAGSSPATSTSSIGPRPHLNARGWYARDEVGYGGAFGVVSLTLQIASYNWQFVPIAAETFADSKTPARHGTA